VPITGSGAGTQRCRTSASGIEASLSERGAVVTKSQPIRHAAVVRARPAVMLTEAIGPVPTLRRRFYWCMLRTHRAADLVAAAVGVGLALRRTAGVGARGGEQARCQDQCGDDPSTG
jgi:hypothetical protein